MTFIDLVWLIPVLPLAAAAANGVSGKRLPRSLVGGIACGSVAVSFLLSLGVFIEIAGREDPPLSINYFTWIQSGAFRASFGFLLDHLSAVMILVVTFVGLLIHIYSTGYMREDPGFYRFFAYLNLFMFAMLTLVLANNYLLMFVGWEGVGLCSYLLIGFWFERKSAADAGKKAFIVNRVGDFGFLLAAMLIFWTFGSLDYRQVFALAEGAQYEPLGVVGTLTAICLLLLVGATGKSAQIPLHVWLPDAMEGPTPVSALIHAATMVTAGVYMIARSAALFDKAPGALFVVASVGAATAIFAASIALVQTDIKKVLAYSTVSQLGYMFLACGVGAYAAGVFHLMTHAFFKALLFLGAGSVIHGMGGIQDLRKMGGLRAHMPWTFRTFLIGSLAIAGISPLAGFFSKDMILWSAWNNPDYGAIFWTIGLITAALTAFYTFRLAFMAFFGVPRYEREDVHHVHESPASMLAPLAILAVFAVIAGFTGVPPVLGGHNAIESFLSAPVEGAEAAAHGSTAMEVLLMTISVAAALGGIAVAYVFYVAQPGLPAKLANQAHALYTILVNKYYVDEIYQGAIVRPLVQTSREFFWKFIDVFVIDGIVNGSARLVGRTAGALRHMQTGYVRTYAGWIFLGGVLLVAWFLQ